MEETDGTGQATQLRCIPYQPAGAYALEAQAQAAGEQQLVEAQEEEQLLRAPGGARLLKVSRQGLGQSL
ncbi:MAG TPA: hypothetical protein G4O13_06015 [Dehalococcoidia bacterium]|nr:hypothetical protein [Dehalococcoidia bacterium]